LRRKAPQWPAAAWRECPQAPCHMPTARTRTGGSAPWSCQARQRRDRGAAPPPPKAVEHVGSDVIAALYRDFFDGIGHVLDCDLDKAVSDGLGRTAVPDLMRELAESGLNRRAAQGLFLPRTKNLREEIRNELAHHQVCVSERERPSAAITFGAWIGPGTVRPDAE